MYDKSGTENLRAQASVKGPAAAKTVNTDGTSVGGTANLKANATIMTGSVKRTPAGSSDIPATTFRDKAV